MSAAQIHKQAEALKSAVADTSRGANEAWVSRQSLQDLYQKILVMDLEYALDKKVEQDLWNHAFKNQINTLQTQAKDKQNPKRGEIQSSLNLFLETASGFYLQLLQEVCSAFKLDLPFRRKSSSIGILKEYGPVISKVKAPKKSSCMYICQHCLVHLGDIARYRQQIDQAQTYYRHAANLVPYNGQPYNQLAILEAAKGNKLSTVFYYVRSIAVKHQFPVASTNLEKFFNKLVRDTLEHRGKLSMSEIISTFLQFHAFVHLCIDLKKAKSHSEKLIASLPTHITSMSFSSYQLVQMVAINLFAMDHAKRNLAAENSDEGKDDKKETLSNDEQQCYEMVFHLTVSLLENLLHHTPKQENKAKEYHTLPVLKVLFDWLRTDRELPSNPAFKNSSIWPNISKLLNNLQFHNGPKDIAWDLEKYTAVPLPEDCDLQCFQPIIKAYSDLDFHLMPSDGLSPELELRLRCHRVIENGVWICEEFPSLNLLNVQKLRSGRLQFSAPTAQVRILPLSENSGMLEKKSYRQNVAIQAIMQNKAKNRKKSGETKLSVQPGLNDENLSGSEPLAMSPPSSSDAGVSTHETERSSLLTPTMSGGESGPESAKSDHDRPLHPQPKAPFPHGMFQVPFELSGFISRPDSSKTNQQENIAQPQLTQNNHPLAEKQNFPGRKLPQEEDRSREKQKESLAGMPSPSPQSMLAAGVVGQMEQYGLRRESGGPGGMSMRSSQGGSPPRGPPPPQHGRHTPTHPLANLPPSHSTRMPPTFQQLQQLAQQQQQLMAQQQLQQLQARQAAPGHGRGMPIGPGQTGGPLSTGPQIPGQMRMNLTQNSIRSPQSPTGTSVRPQMAQHPQRYPLPKMAPGYPGQNMHSSDRDFGAGPQGLCEPTPKRDGPHGLPSFPQLPYSLPFNMNANTANFGQSLLSPTSPQELEAAIRLTPGAGIVNNPFYGRTGQGSESNQLDIQARSVSDNMPSDSLLSHHFSVSPGMNISFNPVTEEPPKPDSPPTRHLVNRIQGGDMFAATSDVGLDVPSNSAPYMLFSQTPWSVINKGDNRSHGSSPFGSTNSSVRTTPDPFSADERPSGINISLGYNFAPSPVPKNMWSSSNTRTSPHPSDILQGGPMVGPPGGSQSQANNMQAMWSSHSGPSPLEKLLEQQKHQRQTDPH